MPPARGARNSWPVIRSADRPVLAAADLAAGTALGSGALRIVLVTNDPPSEPQPATGNPTVRTITWRQLVWDDTRRDLAEADLLRGRLGAMGIAREDTVVLVGERIQFATYGYWALSMFGHLDAFVFDGPWSVFAADPLCVELLARDCQSPVVYEGGQWDQSSRVRFADVLGAVSHGVPDIVDVRSPQEFHGERVSPPTAEYDHGALVRGHIPGAVHVHYADLLGAHGGFAADEEIRRLRHAAGLREARPEIVYCRTGHRASLAWFVFTRLLGVPAVRVYDGSWTEWGNIVGAPVQR